jgi:tripeptide aminopeptidase
MSQTLPGVAQRFLRYVSYDTQSSETSETYPSTEKQKVLSQLLVDELRALGLTDAAMDDHGYVMATVPSNVPTATPVIGLIAHVDTSPEVSGANVKAQLHHDYAGGTLRLGAEAVLTEEQSPELREHVGHTIITTDGTTLLGADDKAGVAEIMTLVERLQADRSIPHGALRIAFTPDEEVGGGTKHFEVKKFGAQFAYTVDGESPGEVENETFCADSATVTFAGINVHPGYAKDKLHSAIKAAARFIELLPREMAPETTEKRQGYVHPVSLSGSVESASIKLILRDFEEHALAAQHRLLAEIAERVNATFPKVQIRVQTEESYRNMRFILEQHQHVVDNGLEAVRRAGLKPKLHMIRGGTDGARLCYAGLPTPNLFAGGHLFHSRFEWVAVEDMVKAVDTLEHLVRIWVEKSR